MVRTSCRFRHNLAPTSNLFIRIDHYTCDPSNLRLMEAEAKPRSTEAYFHLNDHFDDLRYFNFRRSTVSARPHSATGSVLDNYKRAAASTGPTSAFSAAA